MGCDLIVISLFINKPMNFFLNHALVSLNSVTASLTVEIKTILDDPFIKLLVGRVNNLEDE